MWSTHLVWDGKQIQIDPIATFNMIYGAHNNILFIIKVRIIFVSKWPYYKLTLNYVDYCVLNG